MSYDREKALAAGYIVKCGAPLVDPVTVSGGYRCVDGHSHYVQWGGRTFTVSGCGYDAAFLEALDAAWQIASAHHATETLEFLLRHNQVLSDRGYGDVVLPAPGAPLTYPD